MEQLLKDNAKYYERNGQKFHPCEAGADHQYATNQSAEHKCENEIKIKTNMAN